MSSNQDPVPRHPWLRGAAISLLGVLIGAIAFVFFCHALGLNFNDEGWASSDGQRWQVNRLYLNGSLIGFAVAILLFWIGFIQATHSHR